MKILIAILTLAIATQAHAGSRAVMRSKTHTMARSGSVSHVGSIVSGATHEGNGIGSTRREAIASASFAQSGMRVMSRSVRRGPDGRFYSSTAFRAR